MFLRLCKMGYAQSIKEARELDVRTVLQAFHYEAFCQDWEREYLALNSGGS